MRARARTVASEQRCIVVDWQCRDSEGKAKIEGYMNVSDEEAHHCLSAFGYLACDEPYIPGNFGFKDQWLAMQWIHLHLEVGLQYYAEMIMLTWILGNADDIQVTGISAGE